MNAERAQECLRRARVDELLAIAKGATWYSATERRVAFHLLLTLYAEDIRQIARERCGT